MLKRIKIQGYKSLVDMEVELQPLTVLFGPNAAGKSNFLDALQLLSRIATSRNLRDAFAPPYRGTVLESFTFGPRGIEGLLKQKKVSFSLKADIEPSQKKIEVVRQRLKLRERGEGRFSQNTTRFLDTLNSINYYIEIEAEPKSGILNSPRQTIRISDSGGSGLELIPDLLSYNAGTLSDPDIFEEIPFAAALREELASWFFFYLEPRERMRQPAAVKETRHIGLMGEDIGPFLNTLQALDKAQFKAIEKSLHLLIPEITGIDLDVNNKGEVEVYLMQGETPIPASLLSEGTWRMLGLLALGGAKEPPALLGFEEPENGINPQRLDLIASLLTNLTYNDTQVIVTTHSPTLLDALPRESLYLTRQIEGKTSIEPLASFEEVNPAGKGRLVSERLLRGDFNV